MARDRNCPVNLGDWEVTWVETDPWKAVARRFHEEPTANQLDDLVVSTGGTNFKVTNVAADGDK